MSIKKYVVVSTNNNPDYYVYAKYIEKAWNNLGWMLCVMITNDTDAYEIDLVNPSTIVVRLPEIKGLRDATIAQAGRLYAANYLPLDAIIMTSDMDLLPLQNYWKPEAHNITVYGHDLTDFSYYPMGYVAMTGLKWKEKMRLTYNTSEDLLRDAQETQIAFSEEWEKWWNFDWDLLTKRLKPFQNELTFVNRGRRLTGTFAYGRIDRGDSMQSVPNETMIDAHCENHNTRHPDKWNRFLSIFKQYHGSL